MPKIALPQKINFEKGEGLNKEIVSVEPLFPGFGMTLGNALRRVLLSSLTGVAVVGVKIKGADHEFSSLPNIKEDILEIVMNLKQLRLKLFTNEEVKISLDIHGKKVVTAADIVATSDVEIVNKDLVIANITDMAGSLSLEITARRGMGYKVSDGEKKESKEIGYLEVDSIFSPILNVGIDITNVRVGKMTNWDKLILNIETDGTVSAQEAFEESVKILLEQFNSLIGVMPAEVEAVEDVDAEPVEDKKEPKTRKKKKE